MHLDGVERTERAFGRGRVVTGKTVLEALGDLPPDFTWEGSGDARGRVQRAGACVG